MKKIIYNTLAVLAIAAAAIIFVSCGKSDDAGEGTTYFEFAETEADLKRSEGSIEIEITWTRLTQRSATLELVTDSNGLPAASVAAEGTDYSLSAKSVTFAAGETSKKITVTALTPGTTGDKTFRLRMKSSTATDVMLGQPDTRTNICTITLKD